MPGEEHFLTRGGETRIYFASDRRNVIKVILEDMHDENIIVNSNTLFFTVILYSTQYHSKATISDKSSKSFNTRFENCPIRIRNLYRIRLNVCCRAAIFW
ncbi:MAG: hypothetical protein ACRDE5_17370 [Ginsengibacter sp.]